MGCVCSKSIDTMTNKREDIRDVYKIGKLLGSGAFGQVRECTRRSDGELFAIKIMERRSREVGHWSNENMFRREVQLLGILDSPHIVHYIDFYEDHHFLYAVIEHCEGGELFEQIVKCKRFSEEDASYICRQMLLAVAYVHSINVVHRDIKAENFLFKGKDIDSDLKLIDFGMSARLSSKNVYLSEVCGSPHYLSPELVKRRYNTKADMWALGVLIYLLVYGRYPFDGSGTDAIVKQILQKPVDFKSSNVSPSDDCIEFLSILLERDPKKRASANEALQHKWVEDTEEYRQRRLRAKAAAVAPIDLIDVVRSAHLKVTCSRKHVFSKKAEARLNHLLEKIERQWAQGKTSGEFSRHDKRMNTTPSRYVGGSIADIKALRRAIEQEHFDEVKVCDQEDSGTGSTAVEVTTESEVSDGDEKLSPFGKFDEKFDWDSAEKNTVNKGDEVLIRSERRTVTVSVDQKDTVIAALRASKEFEEMDRSS